VRVSRQADYTLIACLFLMHRNNGKISTPKIFRASWSWGKVAGQTRFGWLAWLLSAYHRGLRVLFTLIKWTVYLCFVSMVRMCGALPTRIQHTFMALLTEDTTLWLEVLTAVTTKMAVFWVVAACSLVCVFRCFICLYCRQPQGDKRQYKPLKLL
jgi:hypothetical protein